ncbi:MAG: redoxin domain-containing protein [Chloroflexia bacterium]|nr:redoxin domain-containing protein [Chloroflexia bacterium]
MKHRIALIVAVSIAGVISLADATSVGAQEPARACASAVWLESRAATPEAGDAGARTIDENPVWLTAELTDACSGETFALTDFAGKTLLVGTMATWCGECHAQLTRLTEAAAQIPAALREDIVLVALSLETDLPPEDLAAYAVKNEFPFVFAVLPVETVRALAADFGQVVTVPPSTPHVIIAPDGAIGELRTGPTSPEDLLALFAAARETAAP